MHYEGPVFSGLTLQSISYCLRTGVSDLSDMDVSFKSSSSISNNVFLMR